MHDSSAQRASDLLWACWQSGKRMRSGLPEDIRPLNSSEGYKIQALLEQRSSQPLFGWKIAATSPAGQKLIGVDRPMAGRLLVEQVSQSGAQVPFGSNSTGVVEAEFAFAMATSLDARSTHYSVREVMDAVESLHPAIEIPDSRYEDFRTVGEAQLIADNACAHSFVLGPPAPNSWRSADLISHLVTASVPGRIEHVGSGAVVLGDPRVALTWLANEMWRIGTYLKAGQIVTTGTCVAPMPICSGRHGDLRYGPIWSRFGSVRMTVPLDWGQGTLARCP